MSVFPADTCSQPATCLLSTAILMHTMHLLIIFRECSHVKPNMQNRIVEKHFIRGDHSLFASSRLSLGSFYQCKCCGECIYACVSASIHQAEPVSQEMHNCVCSEGGRGTLGGGEWRVACRTGDGVGRERCNERCRGRRAAEGAAAKRGEARLGGWHGSGASLCPGPSCPSWSFFADSICSLLYMQNTPCREGFYTWG